MLLPPQSPPDGYFYEGMIVFGFSASKDTLIGKGFYLEVEDTSSAANQTLNNLQEQIKSFLSTLGEDWQLQVQWSIDSDYRDILDCYHENTQQLMNEGDKPWTVAARSWRYADIRGAMESGLLRRERLACFLTRRCSSIPPKKTLQGEAWEIYLQQQAKAFEEKIEGAGMAFYNSKVNPMDDREHYYYIRKFYNPTLFRNDSDPEQRYVGFDPYETILTNCLHTDIVSGQDNEGYVTFKMDGIYHNIIVLTKLPMQTFPSIIRSLTNAIGRDFLISMNAFPLSPVKEAEKEQQEAERMSGEVEVQHKRTLRSALRSKDQKIDALMGGETRPFNALCVVRVWDENIEELNRKTQNITQAIDRMNGAKSHQVNHRGQAMSLFFETVPAWTGGQCRAWDMYFEDTWLADMLPVSNTYVGRPHNGEILYYGGSSNAVGVQTFMGNTPQHALLLGMTGSGKSFFVIDMLSQSEYTYSYTAIIEEGLSYGLYTEVNGCTPIIFQPDSNYTINYFDTLRLPLTPTQISVASTLCLKMVGISNDNDKNTLRSAMIGEYIVQLYDDFYEDWSHKHKKEHREITKLAYIIDQYRFTMPAGASLLEAFVEVRDMRRDNPDEFKRLWRDAGQEKVLEFSKDPEKAPIIRNVGLAFFDSKDFPRHSALVEMMKYTPLDHHDRQETSYIATMLSQWSADGGKYGSLFDGYTNVRLDQQVTHFELGYIPESATELKEACGFLISNYIRQHIITLPRYKRKRLVFEEVARFLNMPGGDKILAEAYAQLRKFNCWVISITQQYAQLKNSPLRGVIFGNSKLFFLMRQNDAEDIRDIAEAINLPDTAQTQIRNFILPENLPDTAVKYSSVLMFTPTEEHSQAGVLRVTVRPEIAYVASSDGEVFEKRKKELRKYDNAIEGVLREVEMDNLKDAG